MSEDDGKKIELRMGSSAVADPVPGSEQQYAGSDAGPSSGPGGPGMHGAYGAGAAEDAKPVMGWIAVGAGILAIFFNGVVFVPIAIVCSIIALFMGQGMWAFLGFLTAFAGIMTSPVLLALLGLGAVLAWFGIPIPT